MMKSKKWLMALSVAGIVAASGVVMAATSDKQDAETQRPAFTQTERFAHKGDMKGFKEDRQALLDLLKIDAETFRSEIKAGKTMVEIAKEHGVSEKKLSKFMTDRMTKHIEEGVKAGRLTTEQADKMKKEMPQRISDIINGKAPMPMGDRHRGPGIFKDPELMALLKVDAETLRSELQAGKTLVTVASEHGVSEQELKSFMIEKMSKRIDEGVKAGRIDTDRADKMKANLDKHVTDMINGKAPIHHGPGMFKDPELLALLKVDADTLRNELQSGKTLVSIANERGVSEQELKTFMIEKMTKRIDEGVKDGRIDSEKAEKMKANLDQRVSDMINGKGVKPGFKPGPKPQE